jgi:predicted aspartyl protease
MLFYPRRAREGTGVVIGRAAILILLLTTAAANGAAAAEDCGPAPAAELRVTLLRDLPTVRIAVDGQPVTLMLDTGAEDTVLDPQTAARLGLVGHYEYPRHFGALGGGTGSGVAATRHFVAGAVDVPDFRIMIGGVSLPDLEGIQPQGLLGADFLGQFAVDLDLPDGRLRLYRPGCLTVEPAWSPPFATIAANRSLHDRLFFPVTLDGRQLFAFIDSGAVRSVIDREAAAALGVGAADLQRAPAATLRGATAATVAAPLHRFKQLRIGEISVQDPELSVAPLGLNDADIILGEDFIEPRRLWLSYAPPQIFIKRP